MPYSQFAFRSLRVRIIPAAISAAFAVFAASSLHAEWATSFGLRLEEGYDSNVYLQKVTDLANQDSFITVIQPKMELSWLSKPFNFTLNYTPRVSIFGSERTENNINHALSLDFKGSLSESLSYEFLNSFCFINGSRTGVIYTGPGGAPALGGLQVRDRRESAWMKQVARVTWNLGPVFLRPVYNGYMHDFRTVQKETPGYVNYADREQYNGGLDIGFKLPRDTWFVTGYRYGMMHQERVLTSPLVYSNTFQRALAGFEGQPTKWLKINLMAGPSFHHFNDNVPECFGRNHTRVYLDSCFTFTPTSTDTLVLAASRFEQMTSGGRSAYQDVVYRAGYVRKLSKSVDLKADFRMYKGEFEAAAIRQDTIYTPVIGLCWKASSQLSYDIQYSYEWAESGVPYNTIGREFSHNLFTLGANYTF